MPWGPPATLRHTRRHRSTGVDLVKPDGFCEPGPCKMAGKLIEFKFRERLCELKGARLAVWLSYFLHANRIDTLAWPSLAVLANETGYSVDVVSLSRNRLIREGWLVSADVNCRQPRKFGRFGSPRLRPVIPDAAPGNHRSGDTSAQTKNRDGEPGKNRTGKNRVHRTVKTTVRSIKRRSDYKREEIGRASRRGSFGALPAWVPWDAWSGYAEMRRLRKRPLTERAQQIEIQNLERLRDAGNDPAEVLDQSTANGWIGLFPSKNLTRCDSGMITVADLRERGEL